MFEIDLTFSRGFQTTESADRIAATAQKSFFLLFEQLCTKTKIGRLLEKLLENIK
jgi:hypothetical protein